MVDEPLGEPGARSVPERRAGIDERRRLCGERVRDRAWAVAEAVHRPTLDEVQVLAALVVVDPGALAAHEDERRPRGDLHQRVQWKLGELHVASFGEGK